MKNSINVEMEYDFPVTRVWKALTEKEALSEWLMPCNFEPMVGHTFQFKTKAAPGFDGIIDCKVLELVENKLLVFSWSGGSLKNTTVRFELNELGDRTHLTFSHSGFEGFLNKLIVQKILSNGWKKKILRTLLPQYLSKP